MVNNRKNKKEFIIWIRGGCTNGGSAMQAFAGAPGAHFFPFFPFLPPPGEVEKRKNGEKN